MDGHPGIVHCLDCSCCPACVADERGTIAELNLDAGTAASAALSRSSLLELQTLCRRSAVLLMGAAKCASKSADLAPAGLHVEAARLPTCRST